MWREEEFIQLKWLIALQSLRRGKNDFLKRFVSHNEKLVMYGVTDNEDAFIVSVDRRKVCQYAGKGV